MTHDFSSSCHTVAIVALTMLTIVSTEARAGENGGNDDYAGLFIGAGKVTNRIVDVDGFADWGNPGSTNRLYGDAQVAGVLAGRRIDMGSAGLRIEIDALAGNLSAHTDMLDPTCDDESALSHFRWMATARVGLDRDIGSTRLFVAGGPALARIVNSVTDTDFSVSCENKQNVRLDPNDSFRSDQTRVGWALGAGIELPLSSRWTMRLDGTYFDFGQEDYQVNLHDDLLRQNTCGPGGERKPCTYSIENRASMARLMFVYRFSQ